MATRILIVYESKYGQTHKIAKFIYDRMSSKGLVVEMMNARHILPVAFSNFDGVIVGAPIYMRNYPRRLRQWVAKHSENLNKKPSAFFSVCMAAQQKDERTQRDLLRISEDFFKQTGWYPKRRKVFSGAVRFSRYNPLLKLMMKWIAARSGEKLDTHRDYEYTKWNEVSRFCDDFVHSLSAASDFDIETWPT